MALPGDVSASALRTDRSTWLVGARPSAASRAVARTYGARAVLTGSWVVARERARPMAAALRRRGLLTYAEANRVSTVRQAARAVADDPVSAAAGYKWRDFAVDPALVPPPVTPTSPAVALVDTKADIAHPEFGTGGDYISTLSGGIVTNPHGTATLAVAAAPANGIGIVGVWPGMRAINVPLPAENISCSESARGIRRATAAGAAVINMSYGSSSFCETEYRALQRATAKGITLVAAAGNEFDQGNPPEFPASLPHVLTVAALATDNERPAYFSNANAAVDLAAPGMSIVTAVPVALDNADGTKDGYEKMNGTSFSAPIVSAAAAWVRAVRPELTVDQVAQVIRVSARDVGPKSYDTSTGFGALDLAAALTKTPPPADPLEPNEDIPFVNGSALGRATKAIWRGGRKATLTALLDVFEDPSDVYRLRVPAGRKVRITVTPRYGNPDLELFDGRAKTITRTRNRVARSRHTGTRPDTVTYRNRTNRTRTMYAVVYIDPKARTLDAGYRLTVR
jgi:hypothetical protein